MSEIKAKEIQCRGLKTSYLVGVPKSEVKGILFFIHGCPDNHLIWKNLMNRFYKEGYLVLAPNLRGIDKSEAPTDKKRSRYSKDSLALDHLELISHYGQDLPVTVVCHDIGSVSGWELARRLGPRLKKLVAINSPDPMTLFYQFRKISQVKKSWYIAFFQTGKIVELFFDKYKVPLAEKTLKLGRYPEITPERVQEAANLFISFLPHYRAAFAELPTRFLKKTSLVDKPMLLWGNKDPFLNIPTQKDLKTVAKFPEIRVLEGGHWLFLEKEDDVFRLIQKN